MKIEHKQDDFGRFTLTSVPGFYDATPSAPDLIVDAPIGELSPSRLALAEALVHLSSVSGEISLDAEMHPATAEILPLALPGSWIHPNPIRFAPADIPSGSTSVFVSNEASLSPVVDSRDSDTDILLTLLPTDEFAGHLSSLRHRWIPTNAYFVGNAEDTDVERWHRRLSTLLVLSHELDALKFYIPSSWVVNISHLTVYVKLFRTVGLSLIVK